MSCAVGGTTTACLSLPLADVHVKPVNCTSSVATFCAPCFAHWGGPEIDVRVDILTNSIPPELAVRITLNF